MSIQVQRRRGTAAENAAFTGAVGEFTYSTDTKRLNLHDGSTAGGILIPKGLDLINDYFNSVTATGTDTIAVSLPVSPGAYAAYQRITFKPAADNTGAATLNVNTLGAKNIYKHTGSGTLTAIAAGDLQQDIPATVIYDGTQFILQGTSSAPAGLTTIASGSCATGSPTVIDITSIPATYRGLVLYVSGASNSVATRALNIKLNGGGGFGTDFNITTQIQNTTVTAPASAAGMWTDITETAAQVSSAVVYFDAYQSGPLKTYRGIANLAATAGSEWTQTATNRVFFNGWIGSTTVGQTGAITGIRLTWDNVGTGVFDGGTYALYGVN